MSATEANLERSGKDTALDSVRRLEERLEDRRGVEEEAESRVLAARGEAERIVAAAREGAAASAAERRRDALARADEEAGRIVAEARDRAERLRALAEKDRPAAVRAVVDMVLPRGDT